MTKFVVYQVGDRVFVTTKKNEVEFLNTIKDYYDPHELDDIKDNREEINNCGIEIVVSNQVEYNGI